MFTCNLDVQHGDRLFKLTFLQVEELGIRASFRQELFMGSEFNNSLFGD